MELIKSVLLQNRINAFREFKFLIYILLLFSPSLNAQQSKIKKNEPAAAAEKHKQYYYKYARENYQLGYNSIQYLYTCKVNIKRLEEFKKYGLEVSYLHLNMPDCSADLSNYKDYKRNSLLAPLIVIGKLIEKTDNESTRTDSILKNKVFIYEVKKTLRDDYKINVDTIRVVGTNLETTYDLGDEVILFTEPYRVRDFMIDHYSKEEITNLINSEYNVEYKHLNSLAMGMGSLKILNKKGIFDFKTKRLNGKRLTEIRRIIELNNYEAFLNMGVEE